VLSAWALPVFLPDMFKPFKTSFSDYPRALRIKEDIVLKWFLFLVLMFGRFPLFSFNFSNWGVG
jgi:hypothetical protein